MHACVSAPEVLTAAPVNGFDLIVSNPPYIKISEWQILQPEVKTWESREALDGGEDGLDIVRMILSSSLPAEKSPKVINSCATNQSDCNYLNYRSILKTCGAIWMELDIDQPRYLQEEMQRAASAGAWWSIGDENASHTHNMRATGSGEKIEVDAVFEDFTQRTRFCKLTKSCISAQ